MARNKMIVCKTCCHEVAKSAKTCPYCGAKLSKPIYKKIWFWIIILLIIGAGAGGAGSAGKKTEISVPDNSTSVEQTQSGLKQDVPITKPETTIETKPQTSTTPKPETTQNNVTTGQKNALKAAKNYLNVMAFSHDGLVSQLVFENYSEEDAKYGADNCGANWNEQAKKSAKNYLSFKAFSYDGLVKQLEFEKFTSSEAKYGADNCGANWNDQAAKSAKEYLSMMAFSRDQLIKQLEFEGYTHDQAVYGVSQNGY